MLKTKLKYLAINLALMAIVIVSIIFLFFNYYLPNTTRHGESITVPSLVGMQLNELEAFLADKELRYFINDSTFSTEVKPNTVLSQHPAEGSKVKQNRKIYISVSSTIPPNIKMPQLKDHSLKSAQMVLKSYGLLMEVEYVPSPFSNLVLDQKVKNKTIEAGTSIPKGTKITLIVGNGSGAEEVEVPDMVGMTLQEATTIAAGIGIQVDVVKNEYSGDFEPGTIIRQKPSGGQKAKLGEIVDLWVSQ